MIGFSDTDEARKRKLRVDAGHARSRLYQHAILKARLAQGDRLDPHLVSWLDDYTERRRQADARLIADYDALSAAGAL